MKAIKRSDGYELQIGDLIVSKHAFGVDHYYISRLTSKFAIAKVSDTYEAKFPKVVNIHFESLPRQKWSAVDYTVYTPKND